MHMKILIAEDEPNILEPYKIILESRNHQVKTALDGQTCVDVYSDELNNAKKSNSSSKPFDIVILDYKMPKKDGLQVAKEIFALVPDQRILFASAFVKSILVESASQLDNAVEMLQKPFELNTLVDKVEDKELFEQLDEFGLKPKDVDELPSHNDLVKLIEMLKQVEKKYLDD